MTSSSLAQGRRALFPIATAFFSLVFSSDSSSQSVTKRASWPAEFSEGSFVDAVIGDFTGTLRPSGLVLRGGTLYFAWSPATHTAFAEVDSLPFTAPTGIATVPLESGKDGVFVCGEGLPQLGRLISAGDGFAFETLFLQGWIGARNLGTTRTGDGIWVHAEGLDDQSVLAAFSANDSDMFEGTVNLTLGERVKDFAMLDWDGDGTFELAVLTRSGLRVFSPDGVEIHTELLSFAKGRIVRTPDGGVDRLALVYGVPHGSWSYAMRSNGYAATFPIDTSGLPAGTLKIEGLNARDLDGDGDADAMVTQRASHHALVLINPTVPGPLHSGGIQPRIRELSSAGVSPAANFCPGLWNRLDGKGELDGLFWLDSTDEMVVTHTLDGLGNLLVSSSALQVADYDGSTLYLEVALAEYVGHSLEVTVWHQSDPITPTTVPPVDAAAVNRYEYPITEPPSGSNTLTVNLPLQTPGSQLPDPEYWQNRNHVYLELRVLDHTAESVEYVEVLSVAMQRDPADVQHLDYLLGLPGEGSLVVPVGGPNRPTIVGGIVTFKEMPPFCINEIPDPTGEG